MDSRKFEEISKNAFDDEGVPTNTSREQVSVENSIKGIYSDGRSRSSFYLKRLEKKNHQKFVLTSLEYLPGAYQCLDASRTWLCYWSLHSLSLMNNQGNHMKDPFNSSKNIIKFLAKCQHPDGGFGGGPGQYPHLATTYAAINALCIIGTEEAYKVIDRKNLKKFLWSMRSPDGAFFMQRGGEVDIRGVYCAVSVAVLTGIACRKLFDGTAEWIVGCQTYEGGFSGCPGMEAHGGYTFCAFAALFLLDRLPLCDSQSLLRWLVNRQMKFEGGFQGRTNKLVDGCYSFWQASTIYLLQKLLEIENQPADDILFHQAALQEYILECCQYKSGGLLDKPGKRPDLYHTCYTLSGLSLAQRDFDGEPFFIGIPNNLKTIDMLHNIQDYQVLYAKSYFYKTNSFKEDL